MTALSDYLENKIIDWLFRGQAFTPPAGLYVGLFTATPSDAGGGTEVTGNAYARVNLAPSLVNWAGTQAAASTVASTGTNGTTSNNSTIVFPTPTPSGWGVITSIGIFDAASAGNLLAWGALTASKTVNAGDVVDFPAAALSFQIDN